ncbi:MAG: metallopeptidase family protein [Bacteroidota bacterium]|nr:metallopeptidase family protein [Bacteroidota bacterium]
MEKEEFEKIVERAFEKLPDNFKEAIENVGIVVEDYPTDDIVIQMKLPSRYHLLGLYQGVPLKGRGSWYGMTPVAPDKISLYQKNIEGVCRSDNEIEKKIVEVLIHEIGHYFGMSEKEIRDAGY